MPSAYSTSFRLNYQAPGDNLNVWGVRLNTGVFQLIEDALAGRVAFALSGSKTLTVANGVTDEARCLFLDITGGTGGTVTAPAVPKLYLVRNVSSGDVTLTTGGGGVNAVLATGAISFVIGDGSNFRIVSANDFGGAVGKNFGDPTSPTDAANKQYVDNVAVAGGGLPGQGGQGGKFIKTDGVNAAWNLVTKTDVGLPNVDNTSDAAKPVSTATQAALNAKADASSLSAYVTLASTQDITGRKAMVGGTSAMSTATTGLGAAEFRAGVGGAAMFELNCNGAYRAYLGIDTDNVLKFGGGSLGANAYTIWHSNNAVIDTAGSANTIVKRNSNGAAAFGGDVSVGLGVLKGLYSDNTNVAIRTPGASGVIYFQSSSGTTTYGVIGPSVLDLSVNLTTSGNITATGTVTGGSDRKWKTEIQPMERARGLVPTLYKRDGRWHFGYIAQDVLAVAPHAVIEGEDGLHLEILGMVAAVHSQLAGDIDDLRRRLDANRVYE